MRCRDCAPPRCRRMISHGPLIRLVRNSQLTQPITSHRHFASLLKVNREICIPSCVMKSTGLPPRLSETHFTTRRHGRSRLKSGMTINNSACVCGTMEKVLIRQFCLDRAARDITAYPGCGNAPN